MGRKKRKKKTNKKNQHTHFKNRLQQGVMFHQKGELQNALDIYNEIAEHELKLAKLLEQKLTDLKHTEIAFPVQTNAVFLKFPKAWTKTLKQCRFFYMWDTNEWIARIMMSFDSTEEDVLEFYNTLKHLDDNY